MDHIARADPATDEPGPSDPFCRQAWLGVCASQAVVEFAPDGHVT